MNPFHFRQAVLARIAAEREASMERSGKELPRLDNESRLSSVQEPDARERERRRLASQMQRRRAAARAGREMQARYGEEGVRRVPELRREGHSTAVIEALTGMSRATVCRVLRAHPRSPLSALGE